MRQLVLTFLAGSLVTLAAAVPARAAAAEAVAAPEALSVPATPAAPQVPAGAAVPLFGPPQPLPASVTCLDATDYCYCYNACGDETQACLAGCPPLGQPGRFQCISDCYDADWACTSGC